MLPMDPQAKPAPGVVTVHEDWSWPVGIIVGFALIVAVNIAFIVLAVTGADPIAESYIEQPR